MERRALKRKASDVCGIPNKRRCPRNGGDFLLTEREMFTCSGPDTLLMLIIRTQDSYLKEAFGSNQFYNTCVPDSLLAAFHILYIKHLHIRALFVSNKLFRMLMQTLNKKEYTQARDLWIRKLGDFNKLDRFSNVKDHFPIIDKLVCAKVDYHQETPDGNPIYGKTLSKFRPFGDLWALGEISDPALILVHRDVHNRRYDPCVHSKPPLAVVDDRTFELEVLLVGKEMHMYMCFKLSDSTWIRYDNTRGNHFEFIDFERLLALNDVRICLAIYVNTTQAKDDKHGVPKMRRFTGTRPFCFSRHQQFPSNLLARDPIEDLATALKNLSITSS